MAGTQEEPNHKDSPVSISHNDRRPSEPGIASPRSALLSTRGGRNAPVSRGASLSAGLRQSLSPNGELSLARAFFFIPAWHMLWAMLHGISLGSTWMRQQQHCLVSCALCMISLCVGFDWFKCEAQAVSAAPGGANSITSHAQRCLLRAARTPVSRRVQGGATYGSLCRRGQVRG